MLEALLQEQRVTVGPLLQHIDGGFGQLELGSDEAERGVVTVKEMTVGREQASAVKGHEEWKAARFGQQEVPRAELVSTLKKLLAEEPAVGIPQS